MSIPVYVFDPTEKDALSKVRGIGRYLQLLRENFSGRFVFTADLKYIPFKSIFINPFFTFLQTPLLMKRISQKQVAVIHDLIPLKYPQHFPVGIRGKINVFLNKLALKNYDLIITDSNASKKDIVQILKINENKIKVVYPCLPKSFLKFKIENSKLNENLKFKIKNYCLYVGDATWNKNLVNLARAIKLANINCIFVGKVFEIVSKSGVEVAGLPTTRRNVRALAGGKPRQDPILLNHPWQKSLKDFFALAKNDKRFVFRGFITDQELIKLYQQALANILISSDEGFGFSFVEAASQARPSILSNISTLKEISDNKCLLADPNNPKDIADKIKTLLKDGGLRNKLGFEALERSKYFSPQKFQKEFWRCLS